MSGMRHQWVKNCWYVSTNYNIKRSNMVAWGRRATLTFLFLGSLSQILYLADITSINILTVLGLGGLTEKIMLWLVTDEQAEIAMMLWDYCEDKLVTLVKKIMEKVKDWVNMIMKKMGLKKDDGSGDLSIFLIEEGNYINHM